MGLNLFFQMFSNSYHYDLSMSEVNFLSVKAQQCNWEKFFEVGVLQGEKSERDPKDFVQTTSVLHDGTQSS